LCCPNTNVPWDFVLIFPRPLHYGLPYHLASDWVRPSGDTGRRNQRTGKGRNSSIFLFCPVSLKWQLWQRKTSMNGLGFYHISPLWYVISKLLLERWLVSLSQGDVIRRERSNLYSI
jgi:hypothetical protein